MPPTLKRRRKYAAASTLFTLLTGSFMEIVWGALVTKTSIASRWHAFHWPKLLLLTVILFPIMYFSYRASEKNTRNLLKPKSGF